MNLLSLLKGSWFGWTNRRVKLLSPFEIFNNRNYSDKILKCAKDNFYACILRQGRFQKTKSKVKIKHFGLEKK